MRIVLCFEMVKNYYPPPLVMNYSARQRHIVIFVIFFGGLLGL